MGQKDVIYANTRLLRQHRDIICQERSASQHLKDAIRSAMRQAGPGDAYAYESLLRRADKLIAYFGEMSDLIGMLSTSLDRVSGDFGDRLDDNLNWTNRIFASE